MSFLNEKGSVTGVTIVYDFVVSFFETRVCIFDSENGVKLVYDCIYFVRDFAILH